MMGEKKPALRFKGFEGGWDKFRLGDNSDIITGGTPNTKVFEYWHPKEIPWLSSGEVNKKRINFTENMISQSGLSNSSANWVKKNSVIIALAGQGKTRGTVAITNIPLTTNQSVAAVMPNDVLNPEFIFQNLESRYDELRISSSGDRTRGGLNKRIIFETSISAPKIEEQTKIGDYFKHLDTLIAQQQRKYDTLLNVKKSILEKIFPKNNRNISKIKFKGFTDDWEQRKFTDITFLAGEKNKENLPLESYSISNERGFFPQNELFENGGTMRDADKSMYYIVSQNSFAYNPARINVGSIGYYNLPENVIVSSLYEVFKTTEDVDDRFLWHWFKSETFQRMVEQYQEGGVRLYFYYDKLCMCSIALPSVKEQNLIGVTLDKLDTLITLHHQNLTNLKHIKTALLEKMFVTEAA
ncbi:restriction endonuclease subunit S [Methanogenium marinum]|uniref:Restriction endonuclease subunit S n=1 Tax=Methanogenium marinum TaxID=348610 RepID=A0A9Q4PXS0_9EURY|nr:restriction endonuclease subunit S [Methanogenium marinum]MDE4908966.1 restriction endonuclease subunit S [Methanogenium marinum]